MKDVDYHICNITIERSERGSSLYFLHRKNRKLLDCVRLQLDHNTSRTSNHKALHLLHKFFHARKEPLTRNFMVSGNGILGNLPKRLGAKSQQSLSVDIQGISEHSGPSMFRTRLSRSSPAISKSNRFPVVLPLLDLNSVISKPHYSK